MSDEARDEIAAGFRYTHFRADANTGKLLIASFLYAAIDVLSKKGLLDIAELDEQKKEVATRLKDKFAERGMGVCYQKPEQDKYSFEGAAKIDCENRIPLCKAACCRLPSHSRSRMWRKTSYAGISRGPISSPTGRTATASI